MSADSTEVSIEGLALRRLQQLVQPLDPPTRIIRFPQVFNRLCCVLCIPKRDAWKVLRKLDAAGSIEIVPYQGIRLRVRRELPGPTIASVGAPRNCAKRRVLGFLRQNRVGYPSDIARALDLDIDSVLAAAKQLIKDGRVEV